MSIASTQMAMGYVRISDTADRCERCAKVVKTADNEFAVLKCTDGGFIVSQLGWCRSFKPAAKVQVGPTDV